MRIGIDFDDVVADSVKAIIMLHNNKYGTAFKKEEFISYRVEDVWGGTKEEWRIKLNEFFSTDHLVSLDPMAGSLLGISALKNYGHELYIVTGRSEQDIPATEMWLKMHFPEVFREVHYAQFVTKNDLGSKFREKSEICKDNGIKLMIDDNPRVAKECAEAGISVLLFDQPWNKGDFPSNVERVYSWKEIVEKLNSN